MSGLEQNSVSDGFENSPNMVPGTVEAAQQIEPRPEAGASRNSRAKLAFAGLALLFAGGWSFANQEDVKQALGYKPAYACSSVNHEFQACCNHGEEAVHACSAGSEPAEFAAGQCPLMSGEMAAGSSCCQEGQSAALMAALLGNAQAESSEEDSDTGLSLNPDNNATTEPVAAVTEVSTSVEEVTSGDQ